MCGIAGLLLSELSPDAPAWLTAMTQALFHRGPDDGGAVVFGLNGAPAVTRKLGRPDESVDWKYVPAKLGLGARRLAIVDLTDAGHQPMSDPEGRVWLVYNGEIYNHAELRADLAARGMHFNGHSDTEVLLAAYRAWGTGCFSKFDGMWAVAIADWGAGRLILSRDRLGIKPLYLSNFAHGLGFASEIKALRGLPGAPRGVNEARLRDFLCDGRVDHTDGTLFQGIGSVPAGCWIEFDIRGRGVTHDGGAVKRYGSFSAVESDSKDVETKIRDELATSLRSHLQGEVPIGTCLSGGIDSSSIVCLLRELRNSGTLGDGPLTQHTFTASLPDSGMDEGGHARAVVEFCGGLSHHVVKPTPQGLIDALPALLVHQEQPFALPNVYMQWEVMRAAREAGVTVLLDGQGADELFCGYEGHVPPYLAHLLKRLKLVSLAREWRGVRGRHFSGTRLLAHTAASLLPDAVRERNRWRMESRRQPWLARDLFAADESPDPLDELNVTAEPPSSPSPRRSALSRRVRAILLRESLPALLRFEDRNSMAFSIEARVPFLSRRMVACAMAIPVERKIRNGVLKAVFRDALRGHVPDSILSRTDKLGYSIPIVDWMKGGLREWWSDLVSGRSFAERGCFDVKHLDKARSRLAAGDTHTARSLWRAALVEAWAQEFLD